MLLAIADEAIALGEVEMSLRGLQTFRFHAVLGHGSIEVSVDNLIDRRAVTYTLLRVECRAEEAVLADCFTQALSLYVRQA